MDNTMYCKILNQQIYGKRTDRTFLSNSKMEIVCILQYFNLGKNVLQYFRSTIQYIAVLWNNNIAMYCTTIYCCAAQL